MPSNRQQRSGLGETPATLVIDVVADASVVLKWFHSGGESGLEGARGLLAAYRQGDATLHVLDLTYYEVANALLRGRAGVEASKVAVVLESLHRICPTISPTVVDLRLALELAEARDLTMYDAAYAAAARGRGARLATFDGQLLSSSLGHTPEDILQEIAEARSRDGEGAGDLEG
jgi:predicted nucleic acid-binding protein